MHCWLLLDVIGIGRNARQGEGVPGSAAAARNFLEADRSQADEHYLAEGTTVARRRTAGPEGPVLELEALTGDAYAAWVAGLDPDSGEPRGRLRANAAGVRFVEVVVNGPSPGHQPPNFTTTSPSHTGPRKAALQSRSSAGSASTQPGETDPLSEVVVIRPAADQPPHSCAQRPPNPGRFHAAVHFPNTNQ
jgi:hypothetical protein